MDIVFKPVDESSVSPFEIPEYEPDDLDAQSAVAAIASSGEPSALPAVSRVADARQLQYCLYLAVLNSRSSVVRALLRREGVAVDKEAVRTAIEAGLTAMLSLFLETG